MQAASQGIDITQAHITSISAGAVGVGYMIDSVFCLKYHAVLGYFPGSASPERWKWTARRLKSQARSCTRQGQAEDSGQVSIFFPFRDCRDLFFLHHVHTPSYMSLPVIYNNPSSCPRIRTLFYGDGKTGCLPPWEVMLHFSAISR